MQLLVLGGTVFLGRHLVESALGRGHAVTIFHRGQHGVDLWSDGVTSVERILGDRDGGLEALAGRSWDAVIDTCGYLPRLVGDSARRLADSVGHYNFVSTISVYAKVGVFRVDESSPVATLDHPTHEEITPDTYGALKASCEEKVCQALPGRALVVRPGLIVGPHDPSDRFSWWGRRLQRPGPVLAPGAPGDPVQFIDGRDLADWLVRCAEEKVTGIYNATGPASPLSFGDFLDEVSRTLAVNRELVWVNGEFLVEQEVSPYTELPLWVGEARGFNHVDCSAARGRGLTFRPLTETIRDTVRWRDAQPEGLRAGLAAERETAILAAWGARSHLGQREGRLF